MSKVLPIKILQRAIEGLSDAVCVEVTTQGNLRLTVDGEYAGFIDFQTGRLYLSGEDRVVAKT